MGLDVTIQDFLYRILTDSILRRAASADAVFSILSLQVEGVCFTATVHSRSGFASGANGITPVSALSRTRPT